MSLDPKILTNTLTTFTHAASFGYTALMPEAMSLMGKFIFFEVVLIGMWGAFGKSDWAYHTTVKLLTISIFLWLISNSQEVSRQILDSFAKAGLVAGGGRLQLVDLFDPSKIIDLGFENAWSTLKWGFVTAWKAPICFLCGLVIVIAHFIIALQLFFNIILFYIVTVCAVILLPFSIFRPLAFIGNAAISATFAIGVRFMVLAFIVSLSYSTLEQLKIPLFSAINPFAFRDIFNVMFATIAIAYLCWKIPNIASAFFGTPNIDAGSFLGTVAGAVFLASRGASGVASAADAARELAKKEIENATAGGFNWGAFNR